MSATENIDETPSGMLLHGIMSSIAEFYSVNLANEVMKGLVQKASTGGIHACTARIPQHPAPRRTRPRSARHQNR